jgi:hypothetical protein
MRSTLRIRPDRADTRGRIYSSEVCLRIVELLNVKAVPILESYPTSAQIMLIEMLGFTKPGTAVFEGVGDARRIRVDVEMRPAHEQVATNLGMGDESKVELGTAIMGSLIGGTKLIAVADLNLLALVPHKTGGDTLWKRGV